ncbi:hypothetical protein DI09_28p130 [Mitosporidium daphniae]|uniref:histone deacetylase n=1 Tax=Mitosporidium daphniae TaxID=1485682 RepID=A0A098VRU1_9MICR|nr:uncharacterized protein DI09_28p130 [Mitosporidium daphniae]KGG51732.1 hypothetical protein DI09_28p130 [Mitosporidium daphniae]|eukprot:XP_013238160.1 uncharacterized protein DI09_28p130 [Mitosporidium daphniae]
MHRGSSPPNVLSPSKPDISLTSKSFSEISFYSSAQRGSTYQEQEDDSKISITPELQLISPDAKNISPNSRHASPDSGEAYYDSALREDSSTSSIAFSGLQTGVLFDERLLAHENYFSEHPECPSRILAIKEALEKQGLLDRVCQVPARPATDTEVRLVHQADYVSWLGSTAVKEATEYEKESIYYNQHTSDCARLACGGAIEMASKIASGDLLNGFAVIRPPGHHAECGRAFGFCFINNVAVTAKAIQRQSTLKRILIVDWDVHHGNGTQNAFLSDPNVLYISIHRFDDGEFFPCSQDASMTVVGAGAGIGRTVNIPFSDEDMGDAEYIAAFTRIVLPIAYEFDPDMVLVSAGFDAAENDPIGDYHLSPACYAHMTRMLMNLAGGRILLLLEGGYSLEALSNCACACLRALLMDPLPQMQLRRPDSGALHTLNSVINIQSRYWKMLASSASSSNMPLLKDSNIMSRKEKKSLYSIQGSICSF